MAGYFELMDAPDGGYMVALVDSENHLVAMSVTFPDGAAAAKGIANIREIAGTALVRGHRHGRDELAIHRKRHAASAQHGVVDRGRKAARR
ncbi:YegP family protein [Arthrobacter bambusae]